MVAPFLQPARPTFPDSIPVRAILPGARVPALPPQARLVPRRVRSTRTPVPLIPDRLTPSGSVWEQLGQL